jgi:hypothetical protein
LKAQISGHLVQFSELLSLIESFAGFQSDVTSWPLRSYIFAENFCMPDLALESLMNEQEMQFADPDWQPTGSLPLEPADPVTKISKSPPLASHNEYEFQPDTQKADYTQGYGGADRPYFMSPAAQQNSARRANGSTHQSYWWVWLIALIIFFSLIGTLNGASRGSFGPGFQVPGRGGGPGFSSPFRGGSGNYEPFSLQAGTQVSISDLDSSIQIVGSPSNSDTVLVGTDNNANVSDNNGVMTITSGNDGEDLTVIVPQGVELNLQTDAGDISVQGFNGQISAATNSGSIDITQSDLSGQTVLDGGESGSIDFSGMLDPGGIYQFTTNSGDITLGLPGDSAVQIQHSQGAGGSYSSDFPSQNGNAPRASLTTKTNTGSINIQTQ